jgi:Na+/H+-dicarboxylate symporter
MRKRFQYGSAAIPFLAAVLITACDQQSTGVCTAMFAIATATVVDAQSAPAPTAVITTTLLRTGETLTPTTVMDFVTGVYPILDDGAAPKLRIAGDSIRVRAVQGTASAEAIYRFEVPGGCHIQKVSGPDTLVLQ